MSNQLEGNASSNSLMMTYYEDVLKNTLHKTLMGSERLFLGSRDLMENPDLWSHQKLIHPLREWHAKFVPELMTNNPKLAAGHRDIIQSISSSFAPLKTTSYLEWGRFTEFYKAFPHASFKHFPRVRFDTEMDPASALADLGSLALVVALFENVYFQKVLVFKPRISSDNLGVSDPMFRQTVRARNQDDPEIQSVLFNPEFNVKVFAIQCMNSFFPFLQISYDTEKMTLQMKVLRIILMLFEYGLWTTAELGDLANRIYIIATRMANLESLFTEMVEERKTRQGKQADPEAGQAGEGRDETDAEEAGSTAKAVKNLIQSRILMGKILHHLVIMHMDYEVEISLGQMGVGLVGSVVGPLRPLPPKTVLPNRVFLFERMRKKKLYTYYSYILINYLMAAPHPCIPALQPVYWAKLGHINTSLFAHISNMKSDFFLNSLTNISPRNMSYYLLSPRNKYASEAEEFFSQIRAKALETIEGPGFEKGEVPVDSFAWLEESIAKMTQCFRRCQSAEELCAKQLAFSLAKVDHLLLSFLELLCVHGGEKMASFVDLCIDKTFDFLVLMCKDNLQCVNSFFSYFILKHYLELFKRRPLSGTYLVMQLLRNRQCARLFGAHEKVKQFIANRLDITVDRLLERMNQAEDPSNDSTWVTFELTGQIIFICKLVKSVIKDRDQDQLDVSTLFASILQNKLKGVLGVLRMADRVDQRLDSKFEQLNSLEDLVRSSRWIEEEGQSSRMYLGLIALEHVTGLLSAATRNYHQPTVYPIIAGLFKSPDSRIGCFAHLIGSKIGVKTFRKLLKIYSNFIVFPDNSPLFQGFNNSLFDFYLASPELITPVCEDIQVLSRQMRDVLVATPQPDEPFLRLLFKGVLPVAFRFVTGFLAAFSDIKFRNSTPEVQENLSQAIEKVRVCLSELVHAIPVSQLGQEKSEEKERQIDQFLTNVNQNDHRVIPRQTMTKKVDGLKDTIFAALAIIANVYRHRLQDLSRITSYYRFSDADTEKRFLDKMTANLSSNLKFRTEYKLIGASKVLQFGQAIVLKHTWDASMPEFLYTATSCRPFNFSLCQALEGTSQEHDVVFAVFSQPTHPSVQARYATEFYKHRYWKLKSDMLDNLEKNQCLQILRCFDPIYRSSKVFVDYFVSEVNGFLAKADLGNVTDFCLSDRFLTLFTMADNLFRISPAYREYFYRDVVEGLGGKTLAALTSIRQILFELVAYRTFRNQAWNSLFCSFYLLSCFLQTLCENNYVPFKKLMSDGQQAGQSSWLSGSFLGAYNASIQQVILESEVHHRQKLEIDVSDRDDFCRFYSRAIEEVTEYMNGGYVTPTAVHRTRVDVWCGVLFRREPDLDNQFYQMKLSVINYLNAMVESLDRQVIDYLSNKIFVGDLLSQCVYILKLLYLQESREGQKLACADCCRPHKKPLACQRCLRDTSLESHRLIDLYKSKTSGFSSHIIVDIIVAVFRFMNVLEEYDTRYAHFIAELKNDKVRHKLMAAAATGWLPEARPSEAGKAGIALDEIECWEFMTSIVEEIEVYVHVMTETGEGRLELTHYQFKKLPICFFDSTTIQNRFWDQAPVGSLEEKHEAFVNSIDSAIEQLKSEQSNFQLLGRWAFVVSDSAFDLYLVPLYVIVVAINVLCVIFYNRETQAFDSPDLGDATQAVYGLTLADAALSFLCLCLWLSFNCRSEFRVQKLHFKLTYGKNAKMRPHHRLQYYIWNALLCNPYFVCFSLHICLSLLGFWSPFFYTLMLFLAIQFGSLLKGVVLAILSNLKRLFWTLVIIVIVLNFFALLITEWFNGHLDDSSVGACSSYFGCFMNTLNMGVVQDGGVSSYLRNIGDLRDPIYKGVFFVRVIAFILVNLFLLGMFFGIITDAFSEYVKQLTAQAKDKKSVCFTCGLEKATLERYGIDFDGHVAEHNIFTFLYYLIYLRELDQSSFSGVDYQVFRTLAGNDKAAFLPRYHTLKLKDKGVAALTPKEE